MEDKISYNYLWEAYQKEKQTNQLLLLPKTFYQDTIIHINNAKADGTSNPIMVENTVKLLNEFFEKRKQKILIYVAYNKQLPKPVADNEFEFYNKLLQVAKSETLDLTKEERRNTIKLKSIKDIPEIILPSGNKIGPLEKNQIIDSVTEEDKIYLIENTICEQA